MSSLNGRLLARSAEILDKVDFVPAALREDLAHGRVAPGYLYSAAELIGRAADLLSDSAGLVRENERRWRVFQSESRRSSASTSSRAVERDQILRSGVRTRARTKWYAPMPSGISAILSPERR